jgi:hypothetical protein
MHSLMPIHMGFYLLAVMVEDLSVYLVLQNDETRGINLSDCSRRIGDPCGARSLSL